jgi:hypothetical protein
MSKIIGLHEIGVPAVLKIASATHVDRAPGSHQ